MIEDWGWADTLLSKRLSNGKNVDVKICKYAFSNISCFLYIMQNWNEKYLDDSKWLWCNQAYPLGYHKSKYKKYLQILLIRFSCRLWYKYNKSLYRYATKRSVPVAALQKSIVNLFYHSLKNRQKTVVENCLQTLNTHEIIHKTLMSLRLKILLYNNRRQTFSQQTRSQRKSMGVAQQKNNSELNFYSFLADKERVYDWSLLLIRDNHPMGSFAVWYFELSSCISTFCL